MAACIRGFGQRGRRWTVALIGAALLASAGGGCGLVKEGRAWLYGLEAYIYGFPLIMMDLTRMRPQRCLPRANSPPPSTSSPS
jgi:hypothetical protein